jgi:hypothetical protein
VANRWKVTEKDWMSGDKNKNFGEHVHVFEWKGQ